MLRTYSLSDVVLFLLHTDQYDGKSMLNTTSTRLAARLLMRRQAKVTHSLAIHHVRTKVLRSPERHISFAGDRVKQIDSKVYGEVYGTKSHSG